MRCYNTPKFLPITVQKTVCLQRIRGCGQGAYLGSIKGQSQHRSGL
ncbi:peptidase M4 [Acetobacter orientalis]|uniref:Peptidase M4 n=1 Tax=Acetobacter orientalis TaxID=146474 RepID=A0A2Z5ZGB9_9PROT|nr:peptidase M4 [Acetobacter orientalis]